MLQGVAHIANLGPFKGLTREAGDPPADFGRLTLVFARNGRGKSTITHLLRCLELGDSDLAQARRRLGSATPGTARLRVDGTDVALGTKEWASRPLRLRVFDETFVQQNVIDGLDSLPEHGRCILPLVIGEHGVDLVKTSDQLAAEITRLNDRRNELEAEVRRHSQGVDPMTFCGAVAKPNVDALILEAKQALRAQESAVRIAAGHPFGVAGLRNPSLAVIESLLSATAQGISDRARKAVEARLVRLGTAGEQWLRAGVGFGADHECPFCEQATHGLDLIKHYDAYFGSAYEDHVTAIRSAAVEFTTAFGPQAQGEVHAALLKEEARRVFWSEFFPTLSDQGVDADALDAAWTKARTVIDEALAEKLRRPLDPFPLAQQGRADGAEFVRICNDVVATLTTLQAMNGAVVALQAKTAVGSVATAKARLVAEENSKLRHEAPLSDACDDLVQVVADLSRKRAEKEAAKAAIHAHNSTVFRNYETAINEHLEKFQVEPRVVGFHGEIDTAGRGSSDFKIGVEGASIQAGKYTPRAPCMGSVLSSGDRTALALAFFLAQFERDPSLKDTCVVFDDPVSSFDRHRQDMTRDAILLLAKSAKQVIVFSHYADFLADVWSKAHEECPATTLTLDRVPKKGHRLLPWDAAEASLGTYHRLRTTLARYVAEESDDSDGSAQAVCAFLEAYARVVDPDRLPLGQGKWLKHYLKNVERDIATNTRLMGPKRVEELRQLVRFGGPHRHDADFFGIAPVRDPDGIRAFARLALRWVDPARRDD